MLQRTFQHLPGIGARGEERLWKVGIRDWDVFIKTRRIEGISSARKIALDRCLRADRAALEDERWNRFHVWPQRLHYRALAHLERIVYLDIETYGVHANRVAIIGVSDGEHLRLIDGTRADRNALSAVLSTAEAIVTFNGSRFDLPYLERAFNYRPDCFTIDLEPLARTAGFRGGLKRIEHELGITRARTLNGGDPLALWRSYRASGDDHFLELLSAYVEQDVLTLPLLLDRIRRSWYGVASSRCAI